MAVQKPFVDRAHRAVESLKTTYNISNWVMEISERMLHCQYALTEFDVVDWQGVFSSSMHP